VKKFYPKLRSIQIKTGIWTVVILVIFVLGFLWLTNRLSMGSQDVIKVAFSDVMGLEVGDKVMSRGMEVGRVNSIKAVGDRVLVEAKIASEIGLKQGSQFIISDSSLMGGKALMILPGEGLQPLDLRLVQTGNNPEGVMNLIGKASSALDQLQQTLAQLHEPDGLLTKSSNLLDSADKAVQNTGNLARDIKTELSITIAKVEQLTTTINDIVLENRTSLKNTISQSPAAIGRINSTLDSLQSLSVKLGTTAEALNTQEGTAGKLINNKELYEKLSTIVDNLDALVKDIKSNPKKYVKFSVF